MAQKTIERIGQIIYKTATSIKPRPVVGPIIKRDFGTEVKINTQKQIDELKKLRENWTKQPQSIAEALFEQNKAQTLRHYQMVCHLYDKNFYHQRFELIKLAESLAFYKSNKESEDCFKKYIQRFAFQPTKISNDISEYEKFSKQFKKKNFHKHIPDALSMATYWVVRHIHHYRNELFELAPDKQDKILLYRPEELGTEALTLCELTKKYSKENLEYAKAIFEILLTKDAEKYTKLENASKLFISNSQDSISVFCGEMLINILIEYTNKHREFAGNMLDLFDNEQFGHYVNENLELAFWLFVQALENADERFEKYRELGCKIDEQAFENLFKEYYESWFNFIVKNPGEKQLITYVLDLSGYNTDFLQSLRIEYLYCMINDLPRDDEFYFDEETVNFRDALIHIAELGDSLTKESGNCTLNMRFRYDRAFAKMCYRSSAQEGRQEITQLYNEIGMKNNSCNDKSLILDITTLYGVALFYGEGKTMEAYKTLKPLIGFIEKECTEPGLSELNALTEIIDCSNKLGKKRTAKRAQKLMDKLFPENEQKTTVDNAKN
jgi:hypothetical protein